MTKGPVFRFFDEKTDRMIVQNRQNWPNIGPFSYCRITFPNQLCCSIIRKKPLEKNHYIILYYVVIFWLILRLFVIIHEVLISTICCYHVTYEFQSESTLYGLTECQGTPCSRQGPYLMFQCQQRDLKLVALT